MELFHYHALYLLCVISGIHGHLPMYQKSQKELDTVTNKMKTIFSEFSEMMETLHLQMADLDANVNWSLTWVNESVGGLERKVLKGLLSASEIDNNTSRQLRDLQNHIQLMQRDADKMTFELNQAQELSTKLDTSIEELKNDYEDFKKKTNVVWTVKHDVTDLAEKAEENRVDIIRAIDKTRKDLTNTVHTAVQSLVKEIQHNLTTSQHDSRERAPAGCPVPWTLFRKHCYMIITDAVAWKMAKFMCEQFDSHLLELHSAEECLFMDRYLNNRTSSVWTAASIGRRGIWYWAGSKLEVNFDLFKSHYLHGVKRQHCAVLLAGRQALSDITCGKEHAFVCKKFMLPTDTME